MLIRKYSAITSNGTIAYSFSTDRNTWKMPKESNLKNYSIKAITHGKDKYIAVGEGIIVFSIGGEIKEMMIFASYWQFPLKTEILNF
jgi:hypothetical protein